MPEIGATLREARMSAKIDINEVEVRTKIRAKYLRAMENEEWDLLPGEVYVRSFLRTYGDFLGLDSRQLVDDFRRQYENPSEHEPLIAPPSRERRERERQRQQRGTPRRGVPPWAIVGVVLVVVVVVLYIVGTNQSSKHDTTAQTAPTTTTSHHHKHRAGSATHKKVAKKPPPKATSVTLSMVATGEIYICMVNGKGKVLIPGTIYDSGQTIPSQTGKKLLVTFGNSSVQVKANGKPVALPDTAPIGIGFTPTGHAALAAGQDPTCS
jgi:cytoskeleton protein RodZ